MNYLDAVKRTILIAYINAYHSALAPDAFVDTLARIFTLKQKVLANVAAYVQREVEVRGKPLDKTLANISFFSQILVERVERAGNQPIDKS